MGSKRKIHLIRTWRKIMNSKSVAVKVSYFYCSICQNDYNVKSMGVSAITAQHNSRAIKKCLKNAWKKFFTKNFHEKNFSPEKMSNFKNYWPFFFNYKVYQGSQLSWFIRFVLILAQCPDFVLISEKSLKFFLHRKITKNS